MENLEATMVEWRRVQGELTTSQAHFKDDINQHLQEEPNLEDDMNELANLMVELAISPKLNWLSLKLNSWMRQGKFSKSNWNSSRAWRYKWDKWKK